MPERTGWISRKPQVATAKEVDAKWGLDQGPLRCKICGCRIRVRDTYRWVYMNDKSPSPGNFFVCGLHDVPGLEDLVRKGIKAVGDSPPWAVWVLNKL